MVRALSITRPDDWHVHFRDQSMLTHTVPATARHFSRALVMPNLQPALTTLPALLDYRNRILQAAADYPAFIPYMTFYLNEDLSPETFALSRQSPYILGAKLYPAGVTTHAEQGARSIQALYPALEVMQAEDLVLQIHGEILEGDIFEREARFIETCLKPLTRDFPMLRIVLEHISTHEAVQFVTEGPETLAATITPHHLLYNRNHLLSGGIKPHYYCLPLLKHASHQKALLQAATSGNPKFFAGTDSAPHPKRSKESACGCAGIYSAPFALAMYAEAFNTQNALHRLEPFTSIFGANFYHLPLSTSRIELRNSPQSIPKTLALGNTRVVPVAAGESLSWSVYE
jgi:dihydroorotase